MHKTKIIGSQKKSITLNYDLGLFSLWSFLKDTGVICSTYVTSVKFLFSALALTPPSDMFALSWSTESLAPVSSHLDMVQAEASFCFPSSRNLVQFHVLGVPFPLPEVLTFLLVGRNQPK